MFAMKIVPVNKISASSHHGRELPKFPSFFNKLP